MHWLFVVAIINPIKAIKPFNLRVNEMPKNLISFIISNLVILFFVLVGIAFVVACVNMPLFSATANIYARILFSALVVCAPLVLFFMNLVFDYKLYFGKKGKK